MYVCVIMEFQEGKEKFIQAWGTLGSSWGINKAMAQIHALLLISTEPLTTEDVMEQLKISRGNANMNIYFSKFQKLLKHMRFNCILLLKSK